MQSAHLASVPELDRHAFLDSERPSAIKDATMILLEGAGQTAGKGYRISASQALYAI